MNEDLRPYIPSELLEPHLVRLFGWIVEEISSFEEFPSEEQWRFWSEQLHGVSRLMTVLDGGPRPIHASLAFTNARCELDAFYPSYGHARRMTRTLSPLTAEIPWNKDIEEKARSIWEAARKARESDPGSI